MYKRRTMAKVSRRHEERTREEEKKKDMRM